MGLWFAFKFEDKGNLWGTISNCKSLACNNMTNVGENGNSLVFSEKLFWDENKVCMSVYRYEPKQDIQVEKMD